jgi:allantoinase
MKQLSRGDFIAAWGGIASLQLSLPAVWTEARQRGFSASDLARWMSAAPSALCGLDRHKGTLAAGHDADLVVWRPDETFVVRGASLRHRHALTPYEGRRLSGVVHETFLRGETIWSAGEIRREGRGRLL